jgi:hypothetical protein
MKNITTMFAYEGINDIAASIKAEKGLFFIIKHMLAKINAISGNYCNKFSNN